MIHKSIIMFFSFFFFLNSAFGQRADEIQRMSIENAIIIAQHPSTFENKRTVVYCSVAGVDTASIICRVPDAISGRARLMAAYTDQIENEDHLAEMRENCANRYSITEPVSACEYLITMTVERRTSDQIGIIYALSVDRAHRGNDASDTTRLSIGQPGKK